MARTSPLFSMHQNAQAHFLPYGTEEPVQVVATFGELELEYAAIRKNAALLDLPQRGVIEVAGADRLEFLNRMITQELKGMPEGSVRRSFWLNRKGRVDADLRVINLPGRVLFELDVHAAKGTVETLGAFVITEDVTLRDDTDATQRLAIHGPTALMLLGAVAGVNSVERDQAVCVKVEGYDVVVYREDSAGEIGLELIVPASGAVAIYQKLIEVGHDTSHGAAVLRPSNGTTALNQQVRLRPIGWHAYNIARIEAGTAMFNIDFGPKNLPVETGVLNDRVSFKKGCYLGQEVVARMHARGAGKQILVGVKFDVIQSPDDFPLQPIEGSPLLPVVDGVTGAEAVGAITSSTIGPMLGSAAIALAQVRTGHHTAGTVLATVVDGREVRGTVQETLAFLKRS